MKTTIRISTLLLLIILSKTTSAQRDTAFWFAVPEVSQSPGVYSTDLDTAIYLRITAYGQPATVTIYKPANAAFTPITRVIAANKTTTVNLTALKDLLECKPPDQVLTYGLKISSTSPISVYYEQACKLNPEIFSLKGRNGLGTSFWIPGQNFLPNHTYSPMPYNSFDIIATEDNTTVTINPTHDISGHSAGTAYNVTMNKGQTYSATAVSTAANQRLEGSRVTSTKPVAITVKDDLLDAASIWGSGHDLAGDQIIPDNVIGTEYIAVRGGLTSPNDAIFILATQNNTTITQDGTLIGTINAGITQSFFMANPSTYIQTNHPVYVMQMSGLGAEVSTGILPPIVCTGSNAVAYVRSTSDPLYVMLLVRSGGQNNFRFNGNTTTLPGASFAAVPGTGGQWMSAKFTISLTDLPVDSAVMITNSTNLFHMGVVNGTSGGGGNFGYFSNFNTFVITASDSLSACGNTLFLHADSIAGATYSWTGPHGFTSTAVNPVRTNFPPADTGIYTLTASYNGCGGSSTTYVTYSTIAPPAFNLGNDTAYCGAFSRTLSTGSATTHWSTGATGAQITATTPGLYWARDSGTCGVHIDSIRITQAVAPVVNLGNDTSYCGPFSRVLSTAPAAALWSTGVTATQITVTGPGTYWAQVSNCAGSSRDSIIIGQIAIPTINIGRDTAYCGAFSRVLSTAPISVLWSTGVTGTQITVSTPGTYWAQLVTCAGVYWDSIIITQAVAPSFNIGNDTSYCGTFSRVLSTAPASALWSTGATGTQITVTGPGTYWAQVSNCAGSARDSIVIAQVIPPTINIGNDTTYCGPFSRILSTAPESALWSTGVTATQITVSTAGTYWAEITTCAGTVRDSVVITQAVLPSFHLGNDTSYCGAFSRILSTAPTSALWSTGVTATQIIVNTPGIYWAEVTNCIGSFRDSIAIAQNPIPVVNLGTDDSLCAGLAQIIGTPNPGATYQWNTGSTDSVITVSQSGTYIEQENLNGCAASDTVVVSFVSYPVQILPSDTTICEDDQLILRTAYGTNPVWQDGSGAPAYTVSTDGRYWVTVQTICGIKSDTIDVAVTQCTCKLVIPTAFSPNGDGKNDIFRVLYLCPLVQFHFSIYNRWGQKVFETTDPNEGWDGRYKNVPQPIEVYVWMVSYGDPYLGVTKSLEGNVTLLR